MRHNRRTKRFGRSTTHRLAMWRNMTTSLFRYEQVRTTVPKAKELRRVAEKLITKAKKVTPSDIDAAKGAEKDALVAKRLHNIRLAAKTVWDRKVLERLFDVYGERYQDRQGGYTRIYRVGPRPGDAAEMAIIELVDSDPDEDLARVKPRRRKPKSGKRKKA